MCFEISSQATAYSRDIFYVETFIRAFTLSILVVATAQIGKRSFSCIMYRLPQCCFLRVTTQSKYELTVREMSRESELHSSSPVIFKLHFVLNFFHFMTRPMGSLYHHFHQFDAEHSERPLEFAIPETINFFLVVLTDQSLRVRQVVKAIGMSVTWLSGFDFE